MTNDQTLAFLRRQVDDAREHMIEALKFEIANGDCEWTVEASRQAQARHGEALDALETFERGDDE